MPQTHLTADEMFESLNGYDEIAVARHFDAEISALRKRPFVFMRALVFVHHRREGLADHDAKDAALNLTLRDLDDYFAEAVEEINDEEPETEPGKDD